MPREVMLVSPTPLTMRDIAAAGAERDPNLGVRAIADGNAVQLVDEQGVAVLTIENSRRIDDSGDIERLLGSAPVVPPGSWWIDAIAPWGTAGARGVAFAQHLATELGATIWIEDGS